MTRVTATEARQRLFQLLDAAERGESVVLERKGVRFRLVVEPARADPFVAADCPLTVNDQGLLSGEWHWEFNPEGEPAFIG
jgi:antitoxin (DNA-binding transcriptional repressor) of toxin-antitoxin stability system